MAGVRGCAGAVIQTVARWARDHLAAWLVAAAAVCGALAIFMAVLIALPGQPDATVSVLILVLLLVLALSVIFPVAGHAVEKQDRAIEREHERQDQVAQREQARRERIDRLLSRGSCAGLPQMSELADDLLGVTPTGYSIEGSAPYVPRGAADEEIRSLLGHPGPPYPFVIVWGTTKAGKSRTLAEALRATFACDPVVVLPRVGQALADLARLGVSSLVDHRPAVVVLDDLDVAGLEALNAETLGSVRGWAVIAATMTVQQRARVLTTRGGVAGIARAALAATSGEYELASGPPVGVEKNEAERLYPRERFDGSIAETMVGARELIARYKASHDSNPAGCAVVRAAIDARRAGVSRPVTDAELRRLFSFYLRAVRTGPIPTDEQFIAGVQWAARPVASQVALLRPSRHGQEVPAWTVFDHAVTADEGQGGQFRPIPAEAWAEIIDMLPPLDTFPVAMTAFTASENSIAVTAFRKAASCSHADVAPLAAVSLGSLLARHRDFDGARAAYQQAIDSGHAYAAPLAAVGLGLMLAIQRDMVGARAAYQQAIDSGHADAVPRAALGLGDLLAEHSDVDGARAAYQQAIDSGHADQAPRAARNLGVLLREQGDVDGARAAYQQAIDSGHADAAPMAAFGLGGLLADHSDVDGARAAYQQAIDSGHADQAPSAALNLGVLLREQGMWTVRGPPTSRPSTPVTLVPLPERQLASVFFWPSTAI